MKLQEKLLRIKLKSLRKRYHNQSEPYHSFVKSLSDKDKYAVAVQLIRFHAENGTNPIELCLSLGIDYRVNLAGYANIATKVDKIWAKIVPDYSVLRA